MKKAFFKATLGAVVAAATITTLSPLGVSAAGKPVNNTCNQSCKTNTTCSTWCYVDSNGKLQVGLPKIQDVFGCTTESDWQNCILNINNCNTSNSQNNSNNSCNTGNTVTEDNNQGSNNSNGSNESEVPVTPDKPSTNPDSNNPNNTEKPDNNQNSNGSDNSGSNNSGSNNSGSTTTNTADVNVSGLPTLPQKYSISIQSEAENKILELMNEKRVEQGLKPLTMDNTLLQVARYKSDHMIQYNYFDHTNPDGTKWTNWLQTIGYKYNATGENIAYNTYDPVELFNQWWNSEGHRKNMMNPSYNKVGIGVVYDKDNNKYMGTQTFSN